MRTTRCYLDAALEIDTEIELPERAANHLLRVLRLRVGDECVLFNGDGHDHAARIVAAGKREARARVLSSRRIDNESPLRIVLLQGVARGEKMDLILQKATELGVAEIQPTLGERSEVKLDAERAEKRVAHWRSVIAAACEQSGRARIPALGPPDPLHDTVRGLAETGERLFLDPQGERRLSSLTAHAPAGGGGLAIAIGPEGGWSPRDRQTLRDAGFTGLRLGPRILRTETAGLAAIAALQALLGDL